MPFKYSLRLVQGRSHSVGDYVFPNGRWVPVTRAVFQEFRFDTRFEVSEVFVKPLESTAPISAVTVAAVVAPQKSEPEAAAPVVAASEPATKESVEPEPEHIVTIDSANITPSLGADLERLSKALLAERMEAAGLKVGAQMNKKEMIAAILAVEQEANK